MKTFLLLLAGLGTMEALAWWWMHPEPAGLDLPVLAYQPPAANPPAAAAAGRLTFMPELVADASRSLRCSRGLAARLDRPDGSRIHFAFLEWDFSDAGSVFKAYKHLPEECLGSIGLKLVEVREPRRFDLAGESLWFDHTVLRDPSGSIVHAFKGTWLSGNRQWHQPAGRTADVPWRSLRWRAATTRFRPAYARVAQGAVSGISQPDPAWHAFQAGLLADLSFVDDNPDGLNANFVQFGLNSDAAPAN
jgi:hypothetical protein